MSSPRIPNNEAGGFLLPSLAAVDEPGFVGTHRPLPTPRSSPLRPGSRHETALIRFLDGELLNVSRKYTKKYTPGGYYDIQSVASDLQNLVDLIWVSATPSLQVQYLLQIANSFNDYLASFVVNLRITFVFLDILDRSFYALITGNSVNPNSTPISAPMASRNFSTTEKVRLNSIIQRTRLHVVKLVEQGPSNLPLGDSEGIEFPTESPIPLATNEGAPRPTTVADNQIDANIGSHKASEGGEDNEDIVWEMAIARIYELSLNEVGEQLLPSR